MKPELIHRLESDEAPLHGPYEKTQPPQVFTCPFCGSDRAPHAPHCGVAIPPLLATGPERLRRPRRSHYHRGVRTGLTEIFLLIFGAQLLLLLLEGQWWTILPILGIAYAIVRVVRGPRRRRAHDPVTPHSPRRSVSEILHPPPGR